MTVGNVPNSDPTEDMIEVPVSYDALTRKGWEEGHGFFFLRFLWRLKTPLSTNTLPVSPLHFLHSLWG